MHTLDDLELLARFWSTIFGRGLDPSTPLTKELSYQRLSPLDSHSNEIQSALRGLQRLQQLANDPVHCWVAEVLFYAHVRCGITLRRSGEVYLTLGLGKKKRPLHLSEEKRSALLAKGLRRFDLACSIYLQHKLFSTR